MHDWPDPSPELPIPVSWRSGVRVALFVGSMTLLAGMAVVDALPIWVRIGFAVVVALGVREILDFVLCARRWRVEGDDVHIPRLGHRDRALEGAATVVDLDPRARATLLRLEEPDGTRLIPTNVMISPRDIRRWMADFPVAS